MVWVDFEKAKKRKPSRFSRFFYSSLPQLPTKKVHLELNPVGIFSGGGQVGLTPEFIQIWLSRIKELPPIRAIFGGDRHPRGFKWVLSRYIAEREGAMAPGFNPCNLNTVPYLAMHWDTLLCGTFGYTRFCGTLKQLGGEIDQMNTSLSIAHPFPIQHCWLSHANLTPSPLIFIPPSFHST